ncbi:CHAT domain-containing protein [Bradyrhizobium neotropicale]|uniref:CHAT domain-containing protein n=1 Tax=Bradyrhizobium neotropicale TaxID=1497615 RepID=UPI001AD7660C|nr:CHAT domain-containing protein [Bradyrhizobium neotropicale]MBO4224734.1 CHAT domain-containing protein [Bradyrhizobium neotropicale]
MSEDRASPTHESLLRQALVGFALGEPERSIQYLEAFLALGPLSAEQETACAPYIREIEWRLAHVSDIPSPARNLLISRLRLSIANASADPDLRSAPEFGEGEPPHGHSEEALPSGGLVRRTPHLGFDAPLQPDALFKVQVYLDTQAAQAGEDSEDVVLPAGTQVQVHLTVSSHFVVLSDVVRTMTVNATGGPSQACSFELAVKPANALRVDVPPLITALFFHNGRPSGKVTRMVSITGLAAAAAPLGRPARVELQRCRTPDLCIAIRAAEANDGRQFECTLSTPLLDAYKVPVTTAWNLPGVAEQLVRGYMQAFTRKQPGPGALIAELRGAGIALFDAAPKSFRNLFWELVDAKKPPREICIVSEEPYVPWELMIPRRKRTNGEVEMRKPLGVEFPIGRWIPPDFVAGRTRIPLTDSYVIAPKYAGTRLVLAFSDAEQALLTHDFAAEPISPATFAQIAEKLTSAGRSLVHFVCHGKDGGDGRQVLQLENGEELSSSQLLGIEGLERTFARKRPFVFINACEVGRGTAALVGLGGFATSFIELGASAVIAPLWSVKDGIAHQVAETFYNTIKLEPNTPFAEIMRRLRAKAYESSSAEDTYAAYCFYGDPCATC